MAVLYCWSSGMLGVCPAAQQPAQTITVATGISQKLIGEMVATAERVDLGKGTIGWFVPNARHLPNDEEGQAVKLKFVESYANRLTTRRFRHKGRVVHDSDE